VYFNLNGEDSIESIENHVLKINANRITDYDARTVATGEFLDVAGTPLDFRTPTQVGERIED
jgi:aldose 1-epimerase